MNYPSDSQVISDISSPQFINKDLTCRRLFYDIVNKLKGYLSDTIKNTNNVNINDDSFVLSLINLSNDNLQLSDDISAQDPINYKPYGDKLLPNSKNGCLVLLNYLAGSIRADNSNENSIIALKSEFGDSGGDPVTFGIYDDIAVVLKIVNVLYSITGKLISDIINVEEYINEVCFYIASLIQTNITIDGVNDIVCHYDYFSNEYIHYQADQTNISNIHNNSVLSSKIPINLSDLEGNINGYIGTGEVITF